MHHTNTLKLHKNIETLVVSMIEFKEQLKLVGYSKIIATDNQPYDLNQNDKDITVKNATAMFTGHREIPEDEIATISLRLEAMMDLLIASGVIYFGTGGAIGFDTLAAQIVLKLKPQYPHIKLIIVVPYRGQEEKWSEKDKAVYNDLLSRADKVRVLKETYQRGVFHARNRFLVDHAGTCICYCTKDSGGTACTVEYAISKGLRIYRVENIYYKLKQRID